MTRFEKQSHWSAIHAVFSALLVAITLLALGQMRALVYGAQQPPQPPTPQPEAAASEKPTPIEPSDPATATDAQRNAALQKIGVNNADQVPNPAEDPAGAAQMVEEFNDALAHPDPPKELLSEPVKLTDYDPQKSYSRLLFPGVAARIGLSAAQSERINELMTERAQKLAAADKAEWPAITAASEEALKNVLTPEQDERFRRGTSQKTIVLRFNKERWVDVLNWFASEVGLQMVMTAPPQGTFTYSDKTEYTPKDALDILNGYLNFKGYTLFRFNEMLILHDFRTGALPLQYLPKITPEDLPNQSRFDYVALTIPLEQRNLNAVRQTIQPFMGPYCVIRTQAGNSIMVVDTVNALREIYAAAMSVYNPDPPRGQRPQQPPQGQRPAPETPEWRSYQLEGVAFQTVQEQVAVFAPSAKPLYNPKSNVVNYLALPSVHALVGGLIARLQEGADPARDAIIKTYSLEKISTASASDIWVMGRRMGGGFGGMPFGQFGPNGPSEFYTQLVTALKNIVPEAQLELNASARKLFVIGTEADHEKVAQTLNNLTASTEPTEAPVVKFYRLKKPGTIDNAVFTMLRVVAPMAQTLTTADGALMVVATASEQEEIAAALDNFQEQTNTPDQQFEFRAYIMTARQVSRFTQIYTQLASTPEMIGAVRIPDPVIPTRFAFWAKPSQHAQIAKIIDQVVNAEAYIEDVQPQGLPEPQEPAAAPAEAPKPAEPAPAPAAPAEAPKPAEPAPAPAAPAEAPKPAEPAPAPAAPAEAPKPAEPAPAPAAPAEAPKPAEPAPAPAAPAEAPKPAEPAPAPAAPAEAPKPAEPAPAPSTPAEAPKPATVAPQPNAESDALARERGQANAAQFSVGQSGAYMTVIPMRRFPVGTAYTIISNTVPGVDVTMDATSPALIIYGPRYAVQGAIELATRLEKQLDTTFEYIQLEKELPAEVFSALPQIEPRVSSSYDRANNRLLLTGKLADVARLKEFVLQIQSEASDEKDGVYYLDVERELPGEIQDYIRRAVPGVELTFSSTDRRFTIIGTPTEQLATAKLITDAIANLPPDNITKYYRFDSYVPDRMIELIRERVRHINTIERDDHNANTLRIVARPYQHEEIAEAIEQIKAEYPFQDENTFVSYKTTREQRERFKAVQDDFTREHGSIKILQDDSTNSFAVWAFPAQHEALKKLLDELATVEPGDKEQATIYSPKYVDSATLISILNELVPNLRVVNDTKNLRLILRGTADDIKEAQDVLATLDMRDENAVERSYKSYPIRGFYSYDGVGSYYTPAYYVRDLSALVPAARVTYDYYNQAVVVWGTEEEHKIIGAAIADLIDKKDLDKRVLRWQIHRATYTTLTAQISAVYPGAIPSYDPSSKTLLVRTNNTVTLDAVRELLELLDPEEVSDFDPQLQYYDVGAAPSSDLLAAVRALVPNAQLVRIDVKNKQLLVIARPAEQKVVADNIANLTKTYGSSDLRLVPYPIYSMDVAALATSMTTAHPGATFEPDVRGGRLLVRATLEDHVIISQEIASINGEDDQEEEGEGQDDSENPKKSAVEPGPRVVVYDVPSGAIAVQARGVIANLFPEVQVYGGTQTTISSATPSNPGQKLAIIANNRTQKMIKQIIDSLTNKPSGELVFAVYPYGSVNADTVDALIGNLMPNAYAIPGPLSATETATVRAQRRATTMTSRRTLQNVVSPGNYNEPIPFYRVDERTQTVAVLASDDTHAKIRDVIEKLSSLTSDDAQATTKVFRLNDPIASQLVAAITSIYTATVPTGISAYELLVYGPASEVNKVEEFIKSVVEDNQFDKGRRHMRLFVLPEEAKYNRDRMVNIINSNFAVNGVSAYPGAVSNQVIVWGLDASLDRVAKFIDEITSVPDESVFKTYPIVNTDVASAAAFLARVCPNLELTPDPVRKQIVAFGTPLQHASIAAALEAFDTKQDPSVRMVVNTYNWDDVPSFWMVYTELHARFPNLLITPSGTDAYVVGAPEADQAKIAQYITARRNNLEEQSVRLETYYLHRINFTRLVQVVPAILPTIAIYPGKGANEVFVVASPLNQERFKRTLAQLESVPDDETEYGIEPKIYHVSPGAATTAVGLLSPMLPGVVMYPLSGERLVVWGGAADHKYVEHSLETIAEAFPVIELKKYPLRYLKLVDVIGFLQARYATEGQFFSSTSGDLMCIAPQVVQEKIAQLLGELDVEEAADTRFQPVAYDISNIPLASHALAVANILRIVPEAVQLPTSTPGYLVFYARPQQHAKIQALIDEMLKERPDLQQRLVAYSVRRMTLAQLSALLLPMYPNVKVGAGVDANQIIILAKPEEHARISQLIQQLNLEHDDGMTARVYRLKNSQLDVGSRAIRTMYPHAIVVADSLSRSLLVKAYDDEQKKIEELVREIDDKDPERNTSFKVFNIHGLDFTYLLAPLRNFYYGDPAFQIQYDTAHEAVLVRGTAIQHKAVEDLITELRAGALADKDVYMQCYTLQGTQQAASALSMLYEIIWEQGRNFMIRRDWNTGHLLVLGRPEDHELVQHVLDTLKPEETELAIFNLTYVDANTASQALSMIEPDGSYVDARFDSNSNRLFVRSTAPKLEEIRLMLIKMGEKGLEKMSPFTSEGSKPAGSSGSRKFYPFGNDPNATAPTESVEPVAPAQASAKPTLEVTEGSGAIRTVTLSGADASEALAEALKGWSLDNQVNVVQGDGGVVQEKDEKETEPQQPNAEEPEVEEKQEETPQAALTHFDELLANLGRTILPTRLSFSGLFTGALVLDDPTESAPVEQAPETLPTNEQETPNVQADAAKSDAPQAQTATADDAQLPPNVYVVVNPDGSLLLSSSDEKALDELQRRLGLVVEQMQENHDQESQAVADDNDVSDVAPTNEDSASADPQSNQYLSYMTPENLEEARSRILLESSTYTVYQIKNISVSQMVPRLQTYLGERLNRNSYNYYQSTDYLLSSARSGIYMRTLTNAPPLSFQQDVSLNTLMVYGSKSDRLAVGAMIVVLDDADLFPQPITKPYKIRVENTSPNRMAQQVLSAFTLKFQTTLMPGNLSPRISPNMTTNTLEVYAPEELAKEIEEYVKEVDKEILEESVRKVRVVELKSVNSRVLTTYLQNLRTQQVQNRMLSTPYIGQAQMGPVTPMGGGYGRGMNAAAARNAARMMQTPGPYGPTF